jgi:phosphatidylglycerophosphatase C
VSESINWALEGDCATVSPSRQKKLVAFDFDGTLTVRDSFRAFLRWMTGPAGYAAGVARLAPDLARYLVRQDRGQLKAAMLARMADGMNEQDLAAAAEKFADIAFDSLMRRDGLRAVKTWLAEEAEVVIVTASPELIVAPFGRRLGDIEVIGTRLSFAASSCLNGHLEGKNCRGAEKVIRLKQRFGQDVQVEAAYGDSRGDREMLAFARTGHYRVLTEGAAAASLPASARR